jgi:membrane protein implicated in regulation of membrane protease activity
MAWWLWILIGLSLFVVEVFVPTDFFMFFIGLAAIAAGIGASTGLLPSLWVQSVSFAVVAVAAVVFLRKPLTRRLSATAGDTHGAGELVGDSVVLTEDLALGGVGKAELRGTAWSVRTLHEDILTTGSRCRVDRVEGLVLWVSPEPRPGAR